MHQKISVTYTIPLNYKKVNFASFVQFQKILSDKLRKKFGNCDVYLSQHPRLAAHVIFKVEDTNRAPSEAEVSDATLNFTRKYVMTGS